MKLSTEAFELALNRLRELERDLPEAFEAFDHATRRLSNEQGVDARPVMSGPLRAAYSTWQSERLRRHRVEQDEPSPDLVISTMPKILR